MALVDVDGSSHLSVDLAWGLAATWRSVCIHQMNWVNFCNGFDHDDTAINISVCIITGSIARSANLPVFSLLRGQFWGFFPRRGDTLYYY